MEAPRDKLLDFAISLCEAIAGKASSSHSVEDVNRALVETFESFTIWDTRNGGATLPADIGAQTGSVMIEPNLRLEVVYMLLGEAGPDGIADPVPPMAWIEALRISANSQASWHSNRASVPA